MAAPDPAFDPADVASQVTSGDPIAPFVDEGDIGTKEATEKADAEHVERTRQFVSGMRPLRKGRTPKVAKPVPSKPRPGTLVKPLTDLYVSLGTMMLPFDQPCATAIINSAPKCAESLEALARENPAVRAAIMRLVETSAWGMVVTAHLPILLAVAMHHVPAVKSNLPPNVHPMRPQPVGPNGGQADDVQ